MSRRKNRQSSPNLPKATLDRARQQAGLEPESEAPEAEAPQAQPAAQPAAPMQAATSSVRKARKRKAAAAQLQQARKGNLENDVIAELLHNPTKHVSEEELHAEYGFVLRDLRNMFVLAAALMVLLVALAQLI